MTTKKLTEKQECVLHTIEDFINKNGKFPSIRELGALLGLKSTSTVSGYVNRLKEKGYLDANKLIKHNLLSERQKQVLNTIITYINDNGYPPTVRELCKLTNLKSTSTMHGHLERLERDGYITKVNGGPRTIRVINRETQK